MTHIDNRRSRGFLVATILATFALSANAGPTKQYDFSLVDKSTLINGAVKIPAEQWAQIKNDAPPLTANSNISSFKFSLTDVAIVTVGPDCGTVTSSGFVRKGDCTLDTASNTISVTNISPPIQGGEIYTVKFTVASCGAANVPAPSIAVYTGSQIGSGDTFSPLNLKLATDISCGNVGCDVPFATYVYSPGGANCTASPTAETCVQGVRGLNSDGTCSNGALSYFVNNYLPTTANNLNFRWPTSSQPTAVFAYRVNIATTSTSEPLWVVSWLNDTGTGKPAFIDAPPCNDVVPFPTDPVNDLPLPFAYGTLAKNVASSVSGATMNIKVDATTLPDVDDIVVIEHERMQFLGATSGGNWSVVRGQNGTATPAHTKDLKVMYTPMPPIPGPSDPTVYIFDGSSYVPIIANPGYTAGSKAKMCKASAGKPNGDGTWSVWLIDGGDGFGGAR